MNKFIVTALSVALLSCHPVYADGAGDAAVKPEVEIPDYVPVLPVPDPRYATANQVYAESQDKTFKFYLTFRDCDIHFNSPTPFHKEAIKVYADGSSSKIGCYFRNLYDGDVYIVVGDEVGIYNWSYELFLPVPNGKEIPHPSEITL